jgi:hypothetical protein
VKSNVVPFPPSASDWAVITAVVKGTAEDSVLIETDTGVMNAGVAFGCLVAPEAGDRVLVSRSDRECYVISVLDRPSNADMSLQFPGHVRMNAPKGRIDLTGGTDLNLLAAGKTRLVSRETQIACARVSVHTDELSTRAREFEAHLGTAKIFAEAIDTVAKRIGQRAENVMRWVEGLETLNIGNLVRTVRKTLMSHSDQAVLTAAKDFRIDGERIHMG